MSDGRSHRRANERRRSHADHERRERAGLDGLAGGAKLGAHAGSRDGLPGQAGTSGRVRNISLTGGRVDAGSDPSGAARHGGSGRHAAGQADGGYLGGERSTDSRPHGANGYAAGRHADADHERHGRTDDVPQMRSPFNFSSRETLGDRLSGTASWLGEHKLVPAAACLVLVLLVVGLAVGKHSSATTDAETDSSYTANYGVSVGDKFVSRATDGDSSGYWESLMTSPLTTVNTGGLTITGASVEEPQLKPLFEAIASIEDAGYDVGISLVDATNGIAISYNADSAFYSASSIKGPYVAALGKYELGDDVTSQSGRISDTLERSDNEAYATLRSIYGNDCMASLVADSGAEELGSTGINDEVESVRFLQSGESISDNNYEFVTPNQLTAMWCVVDEYLASDEPGAEFLASEFAQPETSGLKYVGSAYGTTWSKAGWYPDEGDAYQTTVDAGVVREQTGDVVVTIMLSKGEDFTSLDSVALPLLQLHQELLG